MSVGVEQPVKDPWHLTEEEILDLRREMRENLEKILFELKKKRGLGGPWGFIQILLFANRKSECRVKRPAFHLFAALFSFLFCFRFAQHNQSRHIFYAASFY